MDICVKLDIFEGPLDLLLYLVKKNEIDIYNIPLAEITRQYLEYLEIMKALNLEIAGDFLVMAATLIYLKSKMLLPQDEQEQEEIEEEIRSELIDKLEEYRKFKEAARVLEERRQSSIQYFHRRTVPEIIDLDFTEEFRGFEASIVDLIDAFSKVLKRIPSQRFIEVIAEEYTIEEKIDFILTLLEEKGIIYFDQIWNRMRNRMEAIVTFLALLELIKSRLLIIRQIGLFGQIRVLKPLPCLRSEDGKKRI